MKNILKLAAVLCLISGQAMAACANPDCSSWVVQNNIQASTIGIGITTPGATLDVEGTTGEKLNAGTLNVDIASPFTWGSGISVIALGTTSSFVDFTGGGTGLYKNVYQDTGSTQRYMTNAAVAQFIVRGSGNFSFLTAPSGTAGNAVTFTEAMTVTNSNTVGIGTTSPGAVFEVSGGQIRTSGTTPTIAANACGSSTQGTISGTDVDGKLTVGTASVTSCVVGLSKTYTNAFRACELFPANATAAAAATTAAYVSAISTSSWTLTGSALASAAYYYHCE